MCSVISKLVFSPSLRVDWQRYFYRNGYDQLNGMEW